ncbi:phage tail protein [Rhodoblastus sp.]|jgi:phage tail-like protein|uniref:phage tail protein n=1 Tax=Rhodoblastus sp. TaxID=1962975 RepID=UPI003F9E1855
MADDSYPFTSFNFEVALTMQQPDPLGLPAPFCNGAFSECDGIEMTMEPKTVREGGNNTQQIHLVGPVSYGTLTLKRGMTNNQDLWVWFNAVVGNPSAPTPARGALANAVITMCDSAQKPQAKFNLQDCLPIKLKAAPMNAKDGGVAIEEIHIAYSSFSIEPGQG